MTTIVGLSIRGRGYGYFTGHHGMTVDYHDIIFTSSYYNESSSASMDRLVDVNYYVPIEDITEIEYFKWRRIWIHSPYDVEQRDCHLRAE